MKGKLTIRNQTTHQIIIEASPMGFFSRLFANETCVIGLSSDSNLSTIRFTATVVGNYEVQPEITFDVAKGHTITNGVLFDFGICDVFITLSGKIIDVEITISNPAGPIF